MAEQPESFGKEITQEVLDDFTNHPEKYSIAVWSPRLNKKGNSHLGMLFLEAFTTKTRSSIF